MVSFVYFFLFGFGSHLVTSAFSFLAKFPFSLLSFQALIAVLPQAQIQYFDVEAKTWKPLASKIPSIEAKSCQCAASAGNNMFVAGIGKNGDCIYRYDADGNVWEKQPHPYGKISNLCIVDDYMYAISYDCDQVPQRYSFSTCQWQTFVNVSIANNYRFCCGGVTVLNSKVYVLYGRLWDSDDRKYMQKAGLYCFEPEKNEWEEKAKTCNRHYGSSLFVVNNTLYVAGGYDSTYTNGCPCGAPAAVEAYNEENNTWSIVEQNHIPPNNCNAVEIEGKVYFIINKFPVDSGIRIPSEELYPVSLGEWENVGKIDNTAVLCYLAVKGGSLKSG